MIMLDNDPRGRIWDAMGRHPRKPLSRPSGTVVCRKKNTTMRGYNANNPNFVDMSKPNNPRYTLTLILITHPHPDPY